MRAFRAIAVAAALLCAASPARADNWSGFWLGASVGAAAFKWGDLRQGKTSISASAEAGYNALVGRVLFGLTGRATYLADSMIGSQFRVGGRVGVLALDTLLLHVSGGAVYGTGIGQYSFVSSYFPRTITITESYSAARGLTYYLGAGAEYKLSPQWSVGVDYTFLAMSGAWNGGPPTYTGFLRAWRFRTHSHDVALSLRYRF